MQNAIANLLAADLISDDPAAGRDNGLGMFDALIDRWNLRSHSYRANGETVELSGYATFGWGLRGNALVDIWSFSDGAVGTTIRFYDASIDRVRSTWICPQRNVALRFLGRTHDGRIVLNARADDNRHIRWSFVAIEPQRFLWTAEQSDDGSTWVQTQEIEGTR